MTWPWHTGYDTRCSPRQINALAVTSLFANIFKGGKRGILTDNFVNNFTRGVS